MKGRPFRAWPSWSLPGFLWLALSAAPFAGAPSSLIPDFLKVQVAGGSGLISLGAGYAWCDRKIEAEAAYGFVPEAAAGLDLHILSQKNTLSAGRLRVAGPLFLDPFMTGLAANFTQGPRYEIILPPHQRDYYWPDGLHFWFFAATKLTCELENASIRSVAATLEAGTINQYLRAYFSSDYLGIEDILSLAISLRLYL